METKTEENTKPEEQQPEAPMVYTVVFGYGKIGFTIGKGKSVLTLYEQETAHGVGEKITPENWDGRKPILQMVFLNQASLFVVMTALAQAGVYWTAPEKKKEEPAQ